jgi:hypothetical protein
MSGNLYRKSGLKHAYLQLCLFPFGSENLISSTQEIARLKALCGCLKTDPSVMK